MKSSLFLQDERELKRERRKQSNRESARRSRLRKQVVLESVHPHFLQNGMEKNIHTHAHTRAHTHTCMLTSSCQSGEDLFARQFKASRLGDSNHSITTWSQISPELVVS